MGRVIGTASSGSGSHGENSRMRPYKRNRGKQKKRKKDLEELHRNVLEAKKKLHRIPSRDTKWKTAFAKVLANFADQRQHNDDTTHKKKAAKATHGTKTNPRTICSRLLPEPLMGMYENGAKGRQVHRVGGDTGGTQIARLEGNVLKLLNGDGTNPNSSENSEKKHAKKIELASTKKPVESNGTSESSRFTADSPILGKTKGGKCINRDTEKDLTDREKPVKPRDQPHPQRDNTCKRRLFEPDDENACDENSFRIIDRSKIMDEICFSPTRGMDVDNSGSDNRVKKYPIPNEDGAREKSERQSGLERSRKKFWDWSPYVRYERLCAKIHSENFENDVQRIARDPMIKIRKDLEEFYAPSNHWMEIIVGETSKRCRLVPASIPQNAPLDNLSVSTLAGTERRTSDLELDQESSDSRTIKVGSWHSSNFCGISSENDDTRIRDKSKKSRVEESKLNEDKPQGCTRKNRVRKENSLTDDGVARTTNPVSLFLKTLGDNDPTNGRKRLKTFAAEVAAAAELCGAKEKSDSYLDEPRHTDTDANIESRVRKCIKHVPTILRRSDSRSRLVKRINDDPNDTRRRGKERVDSRTDIEFKDYPREGSAGSSSGTRANDSGSIGSPSIASDLLGLESEDVAKNSNLMRKKSESPLKNIERDATREESTDVEMFDDTSRNEPVPVDRYVKKDHATKSRTREARSRGIGKRSVTFDVDERHSHSSETSKPSDRRPRNAPYHRNPRNRSEASGNFSRQETGVENPPQDLPARFAVGVSDIERRSINRDFGAYGDLSSERLANESEYESRTGPPEQRIRKPVMLFEPIRSMGNNRQSYRSSYETLENTFATVSDAVRHLNVRGYPQESGDHSRPRQQRSAISPVRRNRCHDQRHQRHPERAFARTVRKNPLIPMDNDAVQREIFDIQPSKFLALQQGDGDPRRFPTCAYDDRPLYNNGDLTYIECPEPKNHYRRRVDPAYARRSSSRDAPSRTHAKLPSPTIPPPETADEGTAVNIFGNKRQSQTQIPWAAHRTQLPTAVACPRLCSQRQRPINDVAPAAALTPIPTSNDDPRNGCDIPLPSSQLRHKPRYDVDNTGSTGGILVDSRIRLADGKVGTFVPDDRPAFRMGHQSRHNISRGSSQLRELVGSRSSSVFLQRHPTNGIAVPKVPRNLCRTVDCEHAASAHIKYKPRYGAAIFNGSFDEHEAIPNRVQLADGTIGTFIPESRSAGNTLFVNDDRRTLDAVRTDETRYPQDLHVPGGQEIRSSSTCQCNRERDFFRY